jgi:hypothetical protein
MLFGPVQLSPDAQHVPLHWVLSQTHVPLSQVSFGSAQGPLQTVPQLLT